KFCAKRFSDLKLVLSSVFHLVLPAGFLILFPMWKQNKTPPALYNILSVGKITLHKIIFPADLTA
ncbi:hypothetical protein, partial [Escherichia coli]|uniref:hypothetical protein n=1 Tax=Escherichia coli TaxID=562 RepID=UPI003CE571F2